jgi:hypothetical protein
VGLIFSVHPDGQQVIAVTASDQYPQTAVAVIEDGPLRQRLHLNTRTGHGQTVNAVDDGRRSRFAAVEPSTRRGGCRWDVGGRRAVPVNAVTEAIARGVTITAVT